MNTTVIYKGEFYADESTFELTSLKRYVLKRAHPRSLFIEMAGLPWVVYFMWYQNWMMALGVLVAYRLISYASVSTVDPLKLAETTLGKIVLLHLHPFNIIAHSIGFIVLLIGVWQHSIELVLVGISALSLGHIYGWEKVKPQF
ncbi:MAG: hypothetical protein AB7F59_13370 [Bdellovibrionales bacterium]